MIHNARAPVRLRAIWATLLGLWIAFGVGSLHSPVALAVPLHQESQVEITATASPDEAHYDPGSFLIGLGPESDTGQLTPFLAAHQLELVRVWPELQIAHVRIQSEIAFAAGQDLVDFGAQRQAALEASDLFRFVERDGLVFIAADSPPDLEPQSNDPLAPDQYALDIIRAREAWNITHGDPAVTVAVIDTGYSPHHEDFAFANLWRNPAEYTGLPNIDDDANGYIDDIHGWDWVHGNNNPTDANGHGTHIIGTIAADTNNNTGVAGLARAVRVAPLRIFGPSGSGRISDLVAAIEYAVNQDIPIINLSLTTSSDSPALREAVDRAHQAGALIIAASGNMPIGSSFTTVQYPAVYPSTLAVAATTADDSWAGFSRHGLAVDVAAPGAQILSTHLNNEYRSISGTSMATAHVSAVAALIMSLRPDLDAAAVRQLILTTADDVNHATYPGKDEFLGHGRIDMAAAVLEASRGLTITADGFSIAPAQFGDGGVSFAQTGELRVQVTAPSGGGPARLPVRNAILHYRAHNSADPAENDWQRVLTNAHGEAFVPIDMGASIMLLDLQVGAITRAVEATLLPIDTQLGLEIGATVTVAGSGSLTYTVRLQDVAGAIISATVPVQINATRDIFANGSDAIIVTLIDGEFSGELDPGALSGTVQITATLGPYTAHESIEVLPDKPYTITGPSKLFPEVSISTNAILLEFLVKDQFGNPVRDGTEVTLYANAGTLEQTTLRTTDGRAAVAIKLPTPQLQTVSVWAVVHAGPVEIRVDIPAVRIRNWLPALNVQTPMGKN